MKPEKNSMYLMICDGEPDYLNTMITYVRELRDRLKWDIQADVFSDADALLACTRRRRKDKLPLPDIVFSDIRMEQMDGITFGRQLHELAPKVCLVFVTSHAEYAIEGYEVNAYRYLLKPIDGSQVLQIIRDYMRDWIDTCKWIVKSPYGDLAIELQDIIYMSAEDKYTVIHTVDGDYLDRNSLNELENQLSEFGFYRIHRKYLVNMRHHKGIRDKKVYLTDDILLPMSRRKENLYYGAIQEQSGKGYM